MTDRVELTDDERAQMNCDCGSYPVNGDPEHDKSCFVPVVKSIVSARVQALTAERAAARAEVEELRRWKAEATEVIDGWEQVHKELGHPGRLGQSKHAATLDAVRRLHKTHRFSNERDPDKCDVCGRAEVAEYCHECHRVINGRLYDHQVGHHGWGKEDN